MNKTEKYFLLLIVIVAMISLSSWKMNSRTDIQATNNVVLPLSFNKKNMTIQDMQVPKGQRIIFHEGIAKLLYSDKKIQYQFEKYDLKGTTPLSKIDIEVGELDPKLSEFSSVVGGWDIYMLPLSWNDKNYTAIFYSKTQKSETEMGNNLCTIEFQIFIVDNDKNKIINKITKSFETKFFSKASSSDLIYPYNVNFAQLKDSMVGLTFTENSSNDQKTIIAINPITGKETARKEFYNNENVKILGSNDKKIFYSITDSDKRNIFTYQEKPSSEKTDYFVIGNYSKYILLENEKCDKFLFDIQTEKITKLFSVCRYMGLKFSQEEKEDFVMFNSMSQNGEHLIINNIYINLKNFYVYDNSDKDIPYYIKMQAIDNNGIVYGETDFGVGATLDTENKIVRLDSTIVSAWKSEKVVLINQYSQGIFFSKNRYILIADRNK